MRLLSNNTLFRGEMFEWHYPPRQWSTDPKHRVKLEKQWENERHVENMKICMIFHLSTSLLHLSALIIKSRYFMKWTNTGNFDCPYSIYLRKCGDVRGIFFNMQNLNGPILHRKYFSGSEKNSLHKWADSHSDLAPWNVIRTYLFWFICVRTFCTSV